MKEKMDVRNTRLGTNQLFSRWLKWAKEEKCAYVCGGISGGNLRKLKGHCVWLLDRLTKRVTGDILPEGLGALGVVRKTLGRG